ncbi:MAG: hypothetical protein ABR977_05330, partial [Candidatus Dormibacteria bacterium]
MARPPLPTRRFLRRTPASALLVLAAGLVVSAVGGVGALAATPGYTTAPVVTAVCSASPSSTNGWQVSSTLTVPNYNIDYSATGTGGWVEVTSATVPFTFDTPTSLGTKLYVRWDSAPSKTTGPVSAASCPTPTPT